MLELSASKLRTELHRSVFDMFGKGIQTQKFLQQPREQYPKHLLWVLFRNMVLRMSGNCNKYHSIWFHLEIRKAVILLSEVDLKVWEEISKQETNCEKVNHIFFCANFEDSGHMYLYSITK